MASKLIQLEDGTLVEVELAPGEPQAMSGGIADKVNSTFDKIRPILLNTCRPIADTCKELNKEMNIDQAEVEIGFSFEGEGSIYVTKAKAGASLNVRLILKPKA